MRDMKSEENYVWIENNGQVAYIKPQNYERSKTRKYQKEIGRQETTEYREETDCYICHNGKELTARYEKKEKTKSGYSRIVTVYECENCKECEYKAECIHANHCKTPLEERTKRLYVSKLMKQKREEDRQRITSAYGKKTANEPEYPGRRIVCGCKRRFGTAPLPISREKEGLHAEYGCSNGKISKKSCTKRFSQGGPESICTT